MIFCPYCHEEITIETIIGLFKCKFRLENETIEDIAKISGEPFVTVRHGKCFPFGVQYNSKLKQFKVKK